MPITKNAALVRSAELSRRTHLAKAHASFQESIALESVSDYLRIFGPWARELNHVNKHITVSTTEVEAAAEAYTDVAKHLVEKLHWPADSIKVLPQGSASTQTLIRSPDNSNFDIDAVCQVDISHIDALNPVGFFETIGNELQHFLAKPKKRCWNIPCTGKPFYLEFTPSVPLGTVPSTVLFSMAVHLISDREYIATALAVVDNPTKKWKTSNPAGLTKWVDDISKKQLVRQLAMEAASYREAMANVSPVPEQDVEITDTLRVCIRLFKRHRDMCVHRGVFDKEFKPISIIIVTLLTRCYAGLADLERTFAHPVLLLQELAELMPGMVAKEAGKFHVDNPTVIDENFAERWNHADGGMERYEAFITWCDILAADMETILAAHGDQEIRTRVRHVFGCGPESSNPNGSGGSGYTPPERRPPPPVVKTAGLA